MENAMYGIAAQAIDDGVERVRGGMGVDEAVGGMFYQGGPLKNLFDAWDDGFVTSGEVVEWLLHEVEWDDERLYSVIRDAMANGVRNYLKQMVEERV